VEPEEEPRRRSHPRAVYAQKGTEEVRLQQKHNHTVRDLCRFIQELFGSITPLFRGLLLYSQAIVYRIDNSAGRATGLVGRFGNALSRSVNDSC